MKYCECCGSALPTKNDLIDLFTGADQELEILKMLAMADEPVSGDDMVKRLFGDKFFAMEAPEGTFRAYLHRLNRRVNSHGYEIKNTARAGGRGLRKMSKYELVKMGQKK